MPKKRATGAARPYPYRQRRKDGSYVERWKVELSLGKGPDGKYRTKQITASTFRECERKLKEARERLNRTGRVETNTGGLVRDYTAMFIRDVEHRLAPGTVKQYKRAAWYIDKRIGDMNASDVLVSTARMVQDAPDRPSPAVRTVLSQSLDYAVEDGVLASNPSRAVPPKRKARGVVETSGRRAFSVPELQSMLMVSAGWELPVAARMWFRMLTGMRQGEILGATIDGLRLDGPAPSYTVAWSMTEAMRSHGCGEKTHGRWPCGNIRGAQCPQARWLVPDGLPMRHIRGKLWLKPPKSGKPRVVPLWPQLVAVLRRYLDYTAGWANPHGLLWRHEDGSPITSKEDNAAFKRLLSECGMNPAEHTGHETRYSAVTLLRRAGVDTKTVLEIVGHTTMAVDDLYRTVDMAEKAEAMNELGDSLHLPKGLLPGAGE